MANPKHFDIVICGGGLVGLSAAHAFAAMGQGKALKIALVAPRHNEPDGRTTALLAHSVDYLKELEIWQSLQSRAAVMSSMRIIDNTARLLHAPEATFSSAEIGLDAFGYNVLNSRLSSVLTARLGKYDNFHRIYDKITGAFDDGDQVCIGLENGGKLFSRLVVGADGRNSSVRKFANEGRGIGTRQWQYPQTAIVLNFSHTLPHHNTSTEFHNKTGPFTIVPLTERTSSLVWVVEPQTAARIIDRPLGELGGEIERQMHSIVGKTTVISDVQSFRLGGMKADRMACGRFVLVGEAGHVFPPIGAQGYNLGIRDVEDLANLVGRLFNSPNYDPDQMARQYDTKRRGDITTRTLSVDLLNRSLLSDFLPVQVLRSSAIAAISEIGPLRKFMMREGISPGLGLGSFGSGIGKLGNFLRPAKSRS